MTKTPSEIIFEGMPFSSANILSMGAPPFPVEEPPVDYPNGDGAWLELPYSIREDFQMKSWISGYNHAGVRRAMAEQEARITTVAEEARGDQRRAAPPVPGAGEALPSNPVESETTRGQLQWGLDCVAGALGRPSLLVGEHAAAVVKVMVERDEALAQVDSLNKDLVREQSQHAELFRSHGEALARIEKLEIELSSEQNDHRRLLKDNAPRYVVDSLIHTSNELIAARDAALKSAAEATERADRLEAELGRVKRLLVDERADKRPPCNKNYGSLPVRCRREPDHDGDCGPGDEVEQALARAWEATAQLRKLERAGEDICDIGSMVLRGAEPPAIATSERPIVVGSRWLFHAERLHGSAAESLSGEREVDWVNSHTVHTRFLDNSAGTAWDYDNFRNLHEWISDPPVASKPESEET